MRKLRFTRLVDLYLVTEEAGQGGFLVIQEKGSVEEVGRVELLQHQVAELVNLMLEVVEA